MRVIIVLALAVLAAVQVSAASSQQVSEMWAEAGRHFAAGDWSTANKIYDDILEEVPGSARVLAMKGIGFSNLDQHDASIRQFYQILQDNPNDRVALLGMGLGFGNFGEYHEAQKYFARAHELYPDDTAARNYKEFVDRVISKYPYTPTEKPDPAWTRPASIPDWFAHGAAWWADGRIDDESFFALTEFLLRDGVLVIPADPGVQAGPAGHIPQWARNDIGGLIEGTSSEQEFAMALQYLIMSGVIDSAEWTEQNRARELADLDRYLKDIAKNIRSETRYIEYPNPSGDVIKKFLRDYKKWNYEQEVKSAASNFPDPRYERRGDTTYIYYSMYVNDQPTGLPLDHVSTLAESVSYWESQEFSTSAGRAKVVISHTNQKQEANVWVTWVVRNLGEGVLGHAHVGKGVVEVALGDYGCDGSFQLYDVDTVKRIMTHELGHSIGLLHSDTPGIMYPTMTPYYAYCLI